MSKLCLALLGGDSGEPARFLLGVRSLTILTEQVDRQEFPTAGCALHSTAARFIVDTSGSRFGRLWHTSGTPECPTSSLQADLAHGILCNLHRLTGCSAGNILPRPLAHTSRDRIQSPHNWALSNCLQMASQILVIRILWINSRGSRILARQTLIFYTIVFLKQ